jgi:hypothetical protein
VQTEFTVVNLSRAFASLAYWMARTPLKSQAWKSADGSIVSSGGAYSLRVDGSDPAAEAQIVWEGEGEEPQIGPSFKPKGRPGWIESEALWPDGRRVFGVED